MNNNQTSNISNFILISWYSALIFDNWLLYYLLTKDKKLTKKKKKVIGSKKSKKKPSGKNKSGLNQNLVYKKKKEIRSNHQFIYIFYREKG